MIGVGGGDSTVQINVFELIKGHVRKLIQSKRVALAGNTIVRFNEGPVVFPYQTPEMSNVKCYGMLRFPERAHYSVSLLLK